MRLSPDNQFVTHVLDIVDTIPPGRVMTYGDIAAVLGSRAARVVGQVMSNYGADVAWWRVIRAGGHPPVGHEQRALPHYLAEATPFVGQATPVTLAADATSVSDATDAGPTYRIDYAAARWSPDT